jgi:hypothetical protein
LTDPARTGTEHVVDDFFEGAQSVFAADVDGYARVDMLGAGNRPGSFLWLTGGIAGTPGENVYTDSVDSAVRMFYREGMQRP